MGSLSTPWNHRAGAHVFNPSRRMSMYTIYLWLCNYGPPARFAYHFGKETPVHSGL